MNGRIKYVGRAPYHHVSLRDRMVAVKRGEYLGDIPLSMCKKLWDTSLFVPDDPTKDLIIKYTNTPTADVYHIDGKWEGEDVFVIGTGSSMRGFDYSTLKGKKTIIINYAIREYPEAGALLFYDKIFVEYNKKEIDAFQGIVFASNGSGHKLRKGKDFHYATDISKLPEKFNHGLHGRRSSLAAVNLALIMGAKNVYLLGFDLIPGEKNNHSYLPDPGEGIEPDNQYNNEGYCEKRITEFQVFKKHKKKIFNCNPDSGIKMFKTVDIREVLNGT